MWRHAVVVAVVVLLVGCGSGPIGETPEETMTPVAVPDKDADSEQQRGDMIPGVDGAGVTDARLLASAHRDASKKRSYVWEQQLSINVDAANGSALTLRRQIASVESETTYFLWSIRTRASPVGAGFWTYDAPGQMVNQTVYSDESRQYVRYGTQPDRPVERQRGTITAANHSFIGREAAGSVRRYLDASESNVTETTVEGAQYYRIVASGGDLSGADPVLADRATALVAPDGFVRSLNVTYQTEIRGERSLVRYSFEYERINETVVTEPTWVPEN
jgi:hypothetical protein